MKIVRTDRVIAESPAGTKGVQMRWLLGQREGAPNFAMRHFELAPGGATPHHTHEWEHEVYVLAGQGKILTVDGESDLRPGDAVLVGGGEEHHFANTSTSVFQFLCLIPNAERACCAPGDPNCCPGK